MQENECDFFPTRLTEENQAIPVVPIRACVRNRGVANNEIRVGPWDSLLRGRKSHLYYAISILSSYSLYNIIGYLGVVP